MRPVLPVLPVLMLVVATFAWFGCSSVVKQQSAAPPGSIAERAENLRNIVSATRQVAIDDVREGRYAPDIRSLVLRTDLSAEHLVLPGRETPRLSSDEAAADWAQVNSDYVYLGDGLDDRVNADIVLAHENPARLTTDAYIGVAYADGGVGFLSPEAFQKAMYRYDLYRTQSNSPRVAR